MKISETKNNTPPPTLVKPFFNKSKATHFSYPSGTNLIQRNTLPGTTSSPSRRQIPHGVISRPDFDQYVINNFGVQSVHTGSQQEQEQSILRVNRPASSISFPNWNSWSPGASSEDYSHIIQAIEDAANTFWSIPLIRQIFFYQMDYEPGPGGVAIEKQTTGASYSDGVLEVFRAFSGSRAFPVARSNAQGIYPPVGIRLNSPGSTLGAPAALQSQDRNIRENIVHELGHGIIEAALRTNPQSMIEYNAAAGWVGTRSAVLYDIGQVPVQTAIGSNAPIPAQYRIDPLTWNDPKWIEQPMSYYSVYGGPAEDFSECVAAYVYTPSVLAQRSPARYHFIENGMPGWMAQMRIMPSIVPPAPAGDFPISEEIKHMG